MFFKLEVFLEFEIWEMIYVIDANNLAGKLELLLEDDFDKILISQVKKYFNDKEIKVILVFDSADLMGDKIIEGHFEIVYTPRDSFYKCADDKVLEITSNYLNEEDLKEELVIVTDDIELKEKIKKEIRDSENGYRVKVIRATDFAKKILARNGVVKNVDKNVFSKNDINNLNKELLKKWS